MNDAPWASLLVRPLIVLVVIAALVGLTVGLLVAPAPTTLAAASVEVPRDAPLECEGDLPAWFETRDQCRQIVALEKIVGSELDGATPSPQEGGEP